MRAMSWGAVVVSIYCVSIVAFFFFSLLLLIPRKFRRADRLVGFGCVGSAFFAQA